MKIESGTIKEYIEQLPEERKKAILALRKVLKKNLPKGFKEELNYGMIGYVVPHSLYPKGYHVNPTLPLPFINIASQKNYLALYHMGLYTDKKLLDWFKKEYPFHSTAKLDMGKSCIRFKKLDQIPIDLIAELAQKITPAQWITFYKKIQNETCQP